MTQAPAPGPLSGEAMRDMVWSWLREPDAGRIAIRFNWGDAISLGAFLSERLAPTAPVEASGSEPIEVTIFCPTCTTPLYAAPVPAQDDDKLRIEPGATEAFNAIDVADRLIERAYGDEIPADWTKAHGRVAKARAALKAEGK